MKAAAFTSLECRIMMCLGAFLCSLMLSTGMLSAQDPGPEPMVEPGFASDKLYEMGNIDSVDLSTGNISLRIPIGGSYSVNGGLSYSLMLTYNSSNVWSIEKRFCDIGVDCPLDQHCYPFTKATYDVYGNAGAGWNLSLGRLYDPNVGLNPVEGKWNYVSQDGSQHTFWDTLHNGESTSTLGSFSFMYTRDGSYLRMKYCEDPNASACLSDDPDPEKKPVRFIEYPDGTVHSFVEREPDQWRLESIRDDYGNAISISYVENSSTGCTDWTISDEHRSHTVTFTDKLHPDVTGGSICYVKTVALDAFGGDTAVYTFSYYDGIEIPLFEIPRNCRDNDPQTTADRFDAPLLASVTLPESTEQEPMLYSMQYYNTCSIPDLPGLIKTLTLPTGGGIEWTYQTWSYLANSIPISQCQPSPPCEFCKEILQNRWAGIASKTLLGIDGDPSARTWQYSIWYGWTPTQSGEYQLPMVPEERRTVVTSPPTDTSPTGDDTVYYFRSNPQKYVCTQDPQLHTWDYGLPYTRRIYDQRGHFLSVEYYKGNIDNINAYNVTGNLQRSYGVRYDHDKLFDWDVSGEDAYYRHVNRHLSSTITYYWNDMPNGEPRWEEVNYYDLDGLGHYRTTVTDGNFDSANQKRSDRVYDLATGSSGIGLGTYKIEQDGMDEVTADEDLYAAFPGPESPGHDFQMPIPMQWITGTAQSRHAWENGYESHSELCYNATTKRLERTRIRKNANQQGPNDLVVVYDRNSKGNITDYLTYGGDRQDLAFDTSPPLPLCNLSLPVNENQQPAPEHHVQRNYQYGSVQSEKVLDETGAAITSTVRTIDSTGLVATSTGTDGLTTSYSYDTMDRLRWVMPENGHGADIEYKYTTANGGTPATVDVITRENPGGGVLAHTAYEYDAIGRLTTEKTLLPDSTWNQRDTTYNALGWVTARTELHLMDPNPPPQTVYPQTEFSDFDPFGRASLVTAPDGHTVSTVYTGISKVERTVSIGTTEGATVFDAVTGEPETTVDETPATTTEVYDRQGRLYQVVEPADNDVGAGDTDGEDVTTIYAYDVAGRLRLVEISSDGTTQTRSFTYDDRGFLSSEQMPEKGPSGNGSVSYLDYDSRGNAHRMVDGPIDLSYRYDRAGRLVEVMDTESGTTLRLLTYARSNGVNDWAKGKLRTVTSYNFGIADLPYLIFSDGFESGDISAWDSTTKAGTGNKAFHSFVVQQRFTYGGTGGRVSEVETFIDGHQFTQGYTWTDLGAVETITYPDLEGFAGDPTRVVTNQYTNGMLTEVSPGYASSISYHENGMINELVHGNGITDVHDPDPFLMARPRRISTSWYPYGTNDTWWTGTYKYDGAGNIINIGSDYYLYDKVSRLHEGTIQGTTHRQAYTYDAFGNLDSINTDGGTKVYTISISEASNRLDGAGVAYDASGNLTTWGGFSYGWSPTGELASRTGTGLNRVYRYAADGERVVSHDLLSGVDTFSLRGLDGKVLRSYTLSNGSWSWVRDYIYRGGQLLASETTATYPDNTEHFTLDHLGSIRVVTKADGTYYSGKYHAYYPFGEESTTPTDDNPMRFTGHERDLEGTPDTLDDIDYMHARYYSPIVSRFLSVDPAQTEPGGSQIWNRYSYVINNPLFYKDPDGRNLWGTGVKVFKVLADKKRLLVGLVRGKSKQKTVQRATELLDTIDNRQMNQGVKRVIETENEAVRDAMAKQLSSNRKLRGPEKHGGYAEHVHASEGPYTDVHVETSAAAEAVKTTVVAAVVSAVAPYSDALSQDPKASTGEIVSAAIWDATKALDPIFLTDAIEWVFDVDPGDGGSTE